MEQLLFLLPVDIRKFWYAMKIEWGTIEENGNHHQYGVGFI